MFGYALARRIAVASAARLLIDDTSCFQNDPYRRTYRLGHFNVHTELAQSLLQFGVLRNIAPKMLRRAGKYSIRARQMFIWQNSTKFEPELLGLRLKRDVTWIEPFGQSEDYFVDIKQTIVKDFEPKATILEYNKALQQQILKSNSVALHARWFVDSDQHCKENTSMRYYETALRTLEQRVGPVKLFVFSDDMQKTMKTFHHLILGRDVTFVKSENKELQDVTEFQLMRQCKHFIISKSTFAWWAAWLSEAKDSSCQILYPATVNHGSESITAWNFPNQIPMRWQPIAE